MPATLMIHDEDPADVIWNRAGNLDEIEVFNNQVLIGVYDRSEGEKKEIKTEAGIIVPVAVTKEDQFQSKVGMILRMGPRAFVDINDPQRWFIDQDMAEGDWVVFRPSNGWNIKLISRDKRGMKQELLCKMTDDMSILAKISGPMGPDRVY